MVQYSPGVLVTGTVLVDLPEMADTNTARGGIAKVYMKTVHSIE